MIIVAPEDIKHLSNMKTYIERKLEQIHKIGHEKRVVLSCDIYYDDLGAHRGEQFVVRLHDVSIDEHFRSNHIRKSLKMAMKWLKEH